MSFRGFGGQGGPAPQQKKVDTTSHYETLNVPKTASEADIKKAYRRLAMQHHPDKGGDPAIFTKIQNAHEVLSDPNKRKLYDQGGDEAVEHGHAMDDDGGGMDIFDIFTGGGGRRARRDNTPRKGPPVSFQLSLTLEEMYRGCVKKLRLTRSVSCQGCDGKGGHGITDCQPCQGRGIRVVVQRLGPGMISQSQQTCDACRGEGKVVPPNSLCRVCHGEKITKENKQLDVPIPAGAMEGQTHVFLSEGDQQPGQLPGDVVVEFVSKPHARFERRGRHLFYNLKISLLEALTGFTTYIQHLDGKELKLQSKGVIKPGDVMRIEDQGMPVSYGSGRGIDIGSLYIKFEIVFPTTEQMASFTPKVVKALPKPSTSLHRATPANNTRDNIEDADGKIIDMSREEQTFKQEEEEFKRYLRRQQEAPRGATDEDDHHGHEGGHGGPACQPM